MRAVSPSRGGRRLDGQTIFVHGGAATPTTLLSALAARGPKLTGVTTVGLHLEGPCPHLAPELAGHIRHRALFIGPTARDAVNEGRADYVPIFLSDIPHLISRGILELDCAFINVSPPDAHGFCSLGPSVDATLAAVRSARTVIAQINTAMPRSLGDSFVHVREIDLAVKVDEPPHEHPVAEIGEVNIDRGPDRGSGPRRRPFSWESVPFRRRSAPHWETSPTWASTPSCSLIPSWTSSRLAL
jgi:acyl-CoA hydrolase